MRVGGGTSQAAYNLKVNSLHHLCTPTSTPHPFLLPGLSLASQEGVLAQPQFEGETHDLTLPYSPTLLLSLAPPFLPDQPQTRSSPWSCGPSFIMLSGLF